VKLKLSFVCSNATEFNGLVVTFQLRCFYVFVCYCFNFTNSELKQKKVTYFSKTKFSAIIENFVPMVSVWISNFPSCARATSYMKLGFT